MGAPRSIQSRYASSAISACVGGASDGLPTAREREGRRFRGSRGNIELASEDGLFGVMTSEELARLVPAKLATATVRPPCAHREGMRRPGDERDEITGSPLPTNTQGASSGARTGPFALCAERPDDCRVPTRCSAAHMSSDDQLTRRGSRLPCGDRRRRPPPSPDRSRRQAARWGRGC